MGDLERQFRRSVQTDMLGDLANDGRQLPATLRAANTRRVEQTGIACHSGTGKILPRGHASDRGHVLGADLTALNFLELD